MAQEVAERQEPATEDSLDQGRSEPLLAMDPNPDRAPVEALPVVLLESQSAPHQDLPATERSKAQAAVQGSAAEPWLAVELAPESAEEEQGKASEMASYPVQPPEQGSRY